MEDVAKLQTRPDGPDSMRGCEHEGIQGESDWQALTRSYIKRAADEDGNDVVPFPENDLVVSPAPVMLTENMATMIPKVSTGELRRYNAHTHLADVIEAFPARGLIHVKVAREHVAERWENLVTWASVGFE
jgi:hypothetical protein